MKIAIKGHKTRGQEVIDILESLGGKQGFFKLEGNGPDIYYWIKNELSNLIICHTLPPKDYIKYTLDEYYEKFQNLINTMNDVRTISLTLETAKKWYKEGGDLKSVALLVYTEKELASLPDSWEEFLENYCSEWKKEILEDTLKDINQYFPTEKISKYKALLKLEYLRDCYRQGWVPNWNDGKKIKHCIIIESNTLNIRTHSYLNEFLSFQSEKVAREFLKNFESLIKEAGDLI